MAIGLVALLLVSIAALGFAVLSTRRARRATSELDRLAQTDLLTGLPNRVVFERDGERALAEARRGGRRIPILPFELNRYAVINETYGHEIGDSLMKSVIAQIRSAIGSEVLYRYSGPEFAIIYRDVATIDEARV